MTKKYAMTATEVMEVIRTAILSCLLTTLMKFLKIKLLQRKM